MSSTEYNISYRGLWDHLQDVLEISWERILFRFRRKQRIEPVMPGTCFRVNLEDTIITKDPIINTAMRGTITFNKESGKLISWNFSDKEPIRPDPNEYDIRLTSYTKM